MIVKTKKYKLKTGTYVKLGMKNILRQQWWVFLIAIAIASMAFFIWSIWWIIGAAIALILYILFWLIQFYGIPQLEQNKILFDRLNYEISSKEIMIKVNPRQGMPLKWDNIKRASIGKDYFLLVVSKAQLIYLPFKIFNTENERKFMETVLKRKGYIKEK
ncbi:MAG: YcxB family protein [Cyclobacteriaceae bacterium]